MHICICAVFHCGLKKGIYKRANMLILKGFFCAILREKSERWQKKGRNGIGTLLGPDSNSNLPHAHHNSMYLNVLIPDWFWKFLLLFHIGSVLNYLSCIFRWIWLDCSWRRGWKTSPQSCSSQTLRSQRTVFSSSSAPWSRQVRPSRARTHSYTPQGGSLCVGLMNGKHM